MSITRISFKRDGKQNFAKDVKENVDTYFELNNISKHANAGMVLKTIILLIVYFGSYALILSGSLTSIQMLFFCFIMGIGMAGIGFSISHDALHGAYSSNKTVNRILGLTFDLLGANGYIWKITHNVVHHTYTNIYEHDEDLEVAGFIRLSPNAEHMAIHQMQHFLAFFVYGFATLFWVFVKDYKYFFKPNLGPYKNKSHPLSEWVVLIVTKLLYYTYMLIIPLLVLPLNWWQLVTGFMIVHLTAGVILGIVFQLAHVVEGTEHPIENEEGNIENAWMVHQMVTTADFAHNNKFLSWYIGGLNYQIEHHLFPKICSVHYPEISNIVRWVAEKHEVPYHYNESFYKAVRSHYRTLKKFGKHEIVPSEY